ncbi:hypothetical protein SLU01_33140 [Sporosarcina luteola]|uniref:DUF309 domain-containing protein n=1 Tax=Sporosarcina luteola TaxID=582850 RepID=A0A511ZC33_9BACL|nr:DUF309 domain-containing protein [Sporosarcina luteola]GEN85002.1 hypothetical protein SLU01_33140 [Sporosarcina luteola]
MEPYKHPLFLKFIVYFNRNQDYFECHEVLEEYWKSIPNYSKEHPLTAYILLATGLYHWRRSNFNGAYRTLLKAERRFLDFPKFHEAFTHGIDYVRLLDNTNQAVEKVKKAEPFSSFQLSLNSDELNALVDETAASMHLLPLNSDTVIHKHMLRDRNDILAEREKKKGRPL